MKTYFKTLILSLLFLTACTSMSEPEKPEPINPEDFINEFWKISKAQELVIHRQTNPDEDFYWAEWIPEDVILEVKEIANDYENY